MRIRLRSAYTSLQGEGLAVGIPTTFLRFAGCNLRCPFCDEWQASVAAEAEEWDVRAALDFCREAALPVSFTGGEPTLQQGPLEKLVEECSRAGLRCLLETNCTADLERYASLIDRSRIPDGRFMLTIAASPKREQDEDVLLELCAAYAESHVIFVKYLVAGVRADESPYPYHNLECFSKFLGRAIEQLGNAVEGCVFYAQPIWGYESLDLARGVIRLWQEYNGRVDLRYLPQVHKAFWRDLG